MVEFEPAAPVSERPQTDDSDDAVTGTGAYDILTLVNDVGVQECWRSCVNPVQRLLSSFTQLSRPDMSHVPASVTGEHLASKPAEIRGAFKL